ncbi:MAG: Gfo/Idh/MocA family oxidoreductase [Planctomycetota bacterium]
MNKNRRSFVKLLAATGVVTAMGSPRTQAKPHSVNGFGLEKLRVAVVGVRGRGKALINAIRVSNSAELVALADVDSKVLASTEKASTTLARESDFRKLLDRNDIDIIASATPNHWHALLTILAMQAGKHVYIEKPISHNMFESTAIVEASKKFDKLVQCGFQNRSDTGLTEFFGRLNNGEFGKVSYVHGSCHRGRRSIGKLDKPLQPPKHVDYALWLGPAQDVPIMRPSLHYDWHWDFNTGNGDVGNQGPHEWDLMNWAMGDPEELPTSMIAAGNRFGWKDAGNTPNVMACAGELSGIPFTFEVMDLVPGGKPSHGRGVGVIIHTEQGKFVGGRGGGTFIHSDGKQEKFNRSVKRDGTVDHMQNFLDCVLQNKKKELRSGCKVAGRSSSMAHMANISYQLAMNSSAEKVTNSFSTLNRSEMLERLEKSKEIYRKEHSVDSMEAWRLGPKLAFDNAKSEFTGAFAGMANQKMSRPYNGDFVIPNLAT